MLRLAPLALAAFALVSGCAENSPATPSLPGAVVAPPIGGGFGTCQSRGAELLAVPFTARATGDARGLGEGIHRLNATSFLWTWADYHETFRQDRVSRIEDVRVFREGNGTLDVCGAVDIAAPTNTDGVQRDYVVAVLFEAGAPLPQGPVHVVVDWTAGCTCDPLPRGNATADFPD